MKAFNVGMRMASLALAVTLSACSAPPEKGLSLTDALSVDTTGFARAQPGYVMQFPQDHGPHPDFYLEWWYFTGNVQSASGDNYGYQFTIFRNALAPPASRAASVSSEWSTRQLYSAHLAISHPTGNRFMSTERIARGAAGLAGARASEDGLRVWVEDWSLDGAPDLSRLRIEAGDPEFGLSLNLQPTKPIFFQGENGYSPKGFGEGQASHYYSITRLATEGTLHIGPDTIRVAGQSWFDREWSTSLLSEDQSGWDWFSLQLDQEEDLMYFRLRSAEGNDYVDGSLVGVDGSASPLDPSRVQIRATDSWRSPDTNIEYPTRWTMSVPEHELELVIEAVLPNQELDTRVRYWEGAVTVSGNRGWRTDVRPRLRRTHGLHPVSGQEPYPPLRLPRPADLRIEEGRVFDSVRRQWVVLTPEEWVRQHVYEFLRRQSVPAALLAVEKGHQSHAGQRRSDVTVHDRQGAVWMVVECKAASIPLSQATLAQVSRYASELRPRYVCVTNGVGLFVAAADSAGGYSFVPEFPIFPSQHSDNPDRLFSS